MNCIPVDKKGVPVEELVDDKTYKKPDGATLVYEDLSNALYMCKPQWNGFSWEETATPEEVEAWLYPDGRPVEDETPVFTNGELVTMFEEVGETIATLHEENQMLMEAVAELGTEVSNLREEGA